MRARAHSVAALLVLAAAVIVRAQPAILRGPTIVGGPASQAGSTTTTTLPVITSDTFESYTVGAQITSPWTANNTFTQALTSQAHGGTKSLGVGVSGNTTTATLPLGAAYTKWVLDVWLWVNSSSGTTQYIGLKLAAGGVGSGISISFTPAGVVTVTRSSIAFSGISGSVSLNAWHHYVLTVFQNAAGTLSLTIDGASAGTFSGDTRDGGGNSTSDQVVVLSSTIGPSPPAQFYVDDLFIYNNA